ncbi:carboxylating nicotinate-nucleotide diphosphorylase [Tumebacillus permanentifrigoris]|uniref:Probable nicotinate-nucleotide pyrophosphorylase [carboxylating] n=1 Tax=Tumebacillus permanentifrigoris TaxID=378543 RepID=A0A316DE65_9BACL|nr:carboxylating nicotinate-nucleotide diphosphorylase [Tumebacillus permanentifrigoris]PWK16324.1 nicotinate-nucleotide pyrophosphorylase [carboxylating] [Tumebacillus permanentifrigoris]
MKLDIRAIENIVRNALEEDIGFGDITTNSIVPTDKQGRGVLITKEPGFIAGLDVAELTFRLVDPTLTITRHVEDGDQVPKGQMLMEVTGSARSILTGERVALNFLQRMSGVATRTAKFVDLVRYYNAKIVDTRKTTPGMRVLEKYAVVVGGGRNHRFGLFDAVLIKDNHIEIAGGVKNAIMAARHQIPHTMRVEVEVENMEQIDEALEVKADIIMLDNMTPEQMDEAVEKIAGRALVEASGGVTEETIVEIAKTGVDYISIGALTHSIKSLDISLDIEAK